MCRRWDVEHCSRKDRLSRKACNSRLSYVLVRVLHRWHKAVAPCSKHHTAQLQSRPNSQSLASVAPALGQVQRGVPLAGIESVFYRPAVTFVMVIIRRK